MKRIEILNKLSDKELSTKDVYRALYPKPRRPRRAHFVKLRIVIPDEKGVSRLLSVLFFLPAPMFLVRWIMRRAVKREYLDNTGLSKSDIMKLVSMAGVRVFVHAKDGTKVAIRTI